jgi:uncharacterized protein
MKNLFSNNKFSIQSLLPACKEILLLFAVLFLPGVISQSEGNIQQAFNSLQFNFFIIIIALPQIFLVIYLIKIQPNTRLSHFGFTSLSKKTILRSLVIFVGIYALILIIMGIVSFLPENIEKSFIQNKDGQFSNLSLLPLVLVSSLITGYREEIFFRSYLLTRLRDIGISKYSTVIISTALFSIGHIYQGPLGVIIAVCISFYFSIVFLKNRDLHAVAIAHGLYNFSALFLSSIYNPIELKLLAKLGLF